AGKISVAPDRSRPSRENQPHETAHDFDCTGRGTLRIAPGALERLRRPVIVMAQRLVDDALYRGGSLSIIARRERPCTAPSGRVSPSRALRSRDQGSSVKATSLYDQPKRLGNPISHLMDGLRACRPGRCRMEIR